MIAMRVPLILCETLQIQAAVLTCIVRTSVRFFVYIEEILYLLPISSTEYKDTQLSYKTNKSFNRTGKIQYQ